MQLFYSTIQDSPNWLISDDEAHHCIKGLRHKVGDELEVMDGRGNWVVGTITAITKKNVSIKVLSFRQKDQIPSPQLHLAFPPVKNMSRLEWMMEKAVEVGITDFWLVQTERTEKTQVRLDRLEKIILSAAKQSLKCWLPDIHALTPLPAWLKTTVGSKQTGEFKSHNPGGGNHSHTYNSSTNGGNSHSGTANDSSRKFLETINTSSSDNYTNSGWF